MTQELVIADQTYMPAMSIPQAVQRFNTLVEFVQTVMRENVDYGIIPGTPKPTLLKAGAEKLTTLFGLTTRFTVVEKIEDWTGDAHGGEPFFYYWYRCSLWRGERLIAEADGSCNSRESKYRWRWVAAQDIPETLRAANLVKRGGTQSEFVFAIDKSETGGQYGKPAEYWQAFKDAIAAGTARAIKKKTKAGKEMDAYEIDTTVYRVPNEDIASQVNTVQKMSQKRAFVAVTLIGVNASEFFTQDIEDLEMIGGGASYVPPAAPAAPTAVDTSTGEVAPPASDKQRGLIASLVDKIGWSSEQLAVYAHEQRVDLVALTRNEASVLIEQLQALATERTTQPTDDLAQLADAVKRLRDIERQVVAVPPAFTWNKKQGRAALEAERAASRGRLHTWLTGKADGVPALDELGDTALTDIVYTAAGL